MRMLILVSTVLAFPIFGCASHSRNMNGLSLGMTKAQVIAVMGEPTSTKAQGKSECLVYLHEGTFWTWGHGIRPTREYWIVLDKGKVGQYGLAGDFNSAIPTQRVILDKTETIKHEN